MTVDNRDPVERIDFDMRKYAKLADHLRMYAVANCKADTNGKRSVCEVKAANALDRTLKHLTFWIERYKKLQTELAASRRRESAAVADLKHMDNCDICKHGQTAPDGCDCECDECTLPCVCRDCRNEDKWEWRGPSDGEAHHDA